MLLDYKQALENKICEELKCFFVSETQTKTPSTIACGWEVFQSALQRWYP